MWNSLNQKQMQCGWAYTEVTSTAGWMTACFMFFLLVQRCDAVEAVCNLNQRSRQRLHRLRVWSFSYSYSWTSLCDAFDALFSSWLLGSVAVATSGSYDRLCLISALSFLHSSLQIFFFLQLKGIKIHLKPPHVCPAGFPPCLVWSMVSEVSRASYR